MIRKTAPLFNTDACIVSTVAYVVAWLITYGLARFFWGRNLPSQNSLATIIAFTIPLILVAATALWSAARPAVFLPLMVFFIVSLVLVFLNLIVFHHPLLNYGDNGLLSSRIDSNMPFERWMLGSVVLAGLYHSIWYPLVAHHLFSFPPGAEIYLRLVGAIVMAVFSILALRRYPGRLAVALPLMVPVWLLLGSGYDEYYPFIAPVFMLVLLILTNSDLQGISPLWMGFLLSCLSLLYAGFIPISLFILLIYSFRAGWKNGLLAAIFLIVFTILLIGLLWPQPFPAFIRGYISNLNLGSRNVYYDAYKNQAMAHTPFFTLPFVFKGEHLKDIAYMFFWGGGIASIGMLFTVIVILIKRRPKVIRNFFTVLRRKSTLISEQDAEALAGPSGASSPSGSVIHRSLVWLQVGSRINVISIAILFLWQLSYIFIKMPRLGPVQDIDLFFSVYITFAYFTGLLFDEYILPASPQRKAYRQSLVFSIFTGNASCALLFLLFLGLPVP